MAITRAHILSFQIINARVDRALIAKARSELKGRLIGGLKNGSYTFKQRIGVFR
ncbi:hypothetical protein HLV38_05425 [Berryella wangjianweii]|uniref:Uncharacterized protein n=1 Tax=Berryella wangjianweii TaxID=2734634 RepID=A0A6M8J233_9ACTN|nr:hypothetical protein [Berryella wangjianweii]QKF07617.1 hypothetical protein HLV38_05425 [Berryella wangjianweii]